ncbi:MAG: ABC transporter ATP-binding protein [Herpetosiphonaceae bacterium]|nr:ABC transporter ATP-binding protein [Herpetosiphonaceae bacterium]
MTAQSPQLVVKCTGLVKIFHVADVEVVALHGLDLDVRVGELLALVGPSGAGKSTLLHLLAGLDRPSAGRLVVQGQDVLALTPRVLTSYRRQVIGVVAQQTTRNLLPYLSVRQNVEVLLALDGASRRARRAWGDELLQAVGMLEYASQRASQLSGGQQQRVALACALAHRPPLLLADEPTGEVDWPAAQRILHLLHDLRARYALTIILVTHDPRVAAQADRVVAIRDGRTSTETLPSSLLAMEGMDHVPETHARAELPVPGEHFVVVDQTGQLQLPADQRAHARVGRRVRTEIVAGGILIRPYDVAQIGSEMPTSDRASAESERSDHLYADDSETS